MTDFGGPGDNYRREPERSGVHCPFGLKASRRQRWSWGELVENLNSGTGDFPGVGIEVYSLFSATAGAQGALISASAVGTGAAIGNWS